MKFPLLSTLLLLTPLAFGDEVQMLDGKVYKNCTIDQESDTSLSFMVPVKKGIKDTVTVQKDQVKLIIRSTPDEKAFAKLADTYQEQEAQANQLDYATKGVKAYEEFISKYPASKLKPDAEKAIADFKVSIEKEKEKIAKEEAEKKASEPTAEEMKRFGYDIEANKLLDTIKARAKQGNAVGAMQAYDELRKDYQPTEAYLEATNIAAKLLPQISTNLDKMIEAAKARIQADEKKLEEERKLERKMLSQMTEEQKEELKKRRKERMDALKMKREQYRDFQVKLREKKLRWFNPDPGYVDSLEDLKRVATQDLTEVKQEISDQKEGKSESGKATAAFKKAWDLVDQGKFEEAREAWTVIRENRVKREYSDPLQGRIMDGIAAAKEAEKTKRAEERAKKMAERKKAQELRRKKYTVNDLSSDSGKKDQEKKDEKGKKEAPAPAERK